MALLGRVGSCLAGRRGYWHCLLKSNLAMSNNSGWAYHQDSAILCIDMHCKKSLWHTWGDIIKNVYVNVVYNNPSPKGIGKYIPTGE